MIQSASVGADCRLIQALTVICGSASTLSASMVVATSLFAAPPPVRSSAPIEAPPGVLTVRVALPVNTPLEAGAAPLSVAAALPPVASSNPYRRTRLGVTEPTVNSLAFLHNVGIVRGHRRGVGRLDEL